MKTKEFYIVYWEMNDEQSDAINKLEEFHPELIWDGGKKEYRRISIHKKRNNKKREVAAINPRLREAFLRLEFRNEDYRGQHHAKTKATKHENFDRCFDLCRESRERDIDIASNIIREIKEKY